MSSKIPDDLPGIEVPLLIIRNEHVVRQNESVFVIAMTY
jgi:hypothetical protein